MYTVQRRQGIMCYLQQTMHFLPRVPHAGRRAPRSCQPADGHPSAVLHQPHPIPQSNTIRCPPRHPQQGCLVPSSPRPHLPPTLPIRPLPRRGRPPGSLMTLELPLTSAKPSPLQPEACPSLLFSSLKPFPLLRFPPRGSASASGEGAAGATG